MAPVKSPLKDGPRDWRHRDLTRPAMLLSFAVALLMLIGKGTAWWLTGSAAILSDAAESVVHIVATTAALLLFFFARQPKDVRHPYGHGKAAYFSAGFEGAMIFGAGLYIIYVATVDLLQGPEVRQLGWGLAITGALCLVNLALGLLLVWAGRRSNAIAVVANGKHVLTDMWTSLGVLVGVGLVWLTGRVWLDPLFAIAVGAHILFSAFQLMHRSFGALMDEADPELSHKIVSRLDALQSEGVVEGYHQLRHRRSNDEMWIELHILLDGELPLGDAHHCATRVEKALASLFEDYRVFVTTHLEPTPHGEAHPQGHDTLKDPLEEVKSQHRD